MNFILKNKRSLLLRNKWLVVIFLLAAFLRFYKLAEFPVHLGHDEVSQLYDAISIVQTGRDIYGNPYPFIFQSVNDFKPPFYTYITALSYMLFGWREVTVRIPGAFFGTLSVLGVYFFVKQFLKKEWIAYAASFLTAISPFEIFYSRKSFENQAGVLLMLVGFTYLAKYKDAKNIKFFYLGAILLGLASYVYFAQAVLTPILLVSFFVIFWKKLKTLNVKPIIIFFLIITPLYYMIFVNPATRNRSANVFITQDARLKDSSIVSVVGYSAKRYINQFNPKHLFFDGLNMTEGKRDVGPLFPAIIPFLMVGIYFLLREKEGRGEKLFLLFWILVGFIPSGLTFEDYSPHRTIAAFTVLNIVAAYGVYWFYKRFGKVALILLLILFGANFIFFVKRYTVNYPIERSEALHYPYREVAEYAWENYDKYDTIVFDPKFGEFAPWIGTGAHYYLAFYGHYPPEMMQKEFKIGDQRVRETTFGKFSIRAVFWPEDMKRKNTLIIASPWSLPPTITQEAQILKTFYFKTTAPAFYAIGLK